MKFIDLKDLPSERLNEFIKVFENHKELKNFLGGCPEEQYRVNSNCFYCDECWISALRNIVDFKTENERRRTEELIKYISKSKENGENER